MSDCCSTTKDGVCPTLVSSPEVCPSCAKKGKPVTVLTVKNLVRDHARASASTSYSFCRTPGCGVVYFSDQNVFAKQDLKVRVGIKETADPIPLCYCVGYTREDIRHDTQNDQSSSIQEKIKEEVQGGFCACEVKSPSGACCLGDITRAIQESRQAACEGAPLLWASRQNSGNPDV